MKFNIITIFPNFFESFKSEALISRAIKNKIISINTHNLRDFSGDERGTVDDRPYGGGAGMLLKIEPIFRAVESLKVKKFKSSKLETKNLKLKTRTILLSAKGKTFTQKDARRLAKYDQIIFICGRYEGVDERVAKYVADEEISIGNYILFGGEVPAMVVIEAVSRLIPGVVAKEESVKDESFSKWQMENGKWKTNREYPQYTRPEIFRARLAQRGGEAGKTKGWKVPRVLLSGDHKKIKEWKRKHSDCALDNK